MDGVVDDRRGRGGRGEEWSEAEFEWRASDRNNDWRKRGVRAFSYLFHIRILLVSYSLHTRLTLASHPLPGAAYPHHIRCIPASQSLHTRLLLASYPLSPASHSLPTHGYAQGVGVGSSAVGIIPFTSPFWDLPFEMARFVSPLQGPCSLSTV